ncbi:endosomal transmembrane epsin interactor 1 isoform X2 [Bombina bombina]|uniref:endosomal transmembrane epsin interactor 1 isoform X2 n=1 Tax=Bombina bombina TaxID=8345 RepID=UPI00235AB635|nr:endosomal transmembrane epsin interactor 1 isoform X2 [Bombina bombina]
MSLPVLLPGSCCPMAGLSSSMGNAASTSSPGTDSAHHRPRRSRGALLPPRFTASLGLCPAPPPPSSRRRAGSGLILPGRPLLSLGLLQLILGCCTVALSFGALSLSKSPQIRSSCPFWAGSSVILSGLIGLTTWKKPMILLVEMVEGKICLCCEESLANKCLEKENVLKLFPVQSCNAVHLLLKKVFFALCALNALTTTVCLVAAALRYLQLLTTRTVCTDESQISAEEGEERVPDPDDFIPPAPPPSYFSTFYSCTPRMNQRVLGNEMIPLPHIYGSRFKGIEVFCPMEPPPPYEAVIRQSNSSEESTLQITDLVDGAPTTEIRGSENNAELIISYNSEAVPGPSIQPVTAVAQELTNKPARKRSHSDPVIHELPARGGVPSCEAATQTELRPPIAAVTLRRALRARAVRSRPRSLVDYKSYIDTKLLVARFLEEPSCSMAPDIQQLVESIKTVLKSDEEHMDEAILSANFLDQVMAPGQQTSATAHRLPCRRYPGFLHLESCGDLSTFCAAENQSSVRRNRRTLSERPHSLIGVVRETVL